MDNSENVTVWSDIPHQDQLWGFVPLVQDVFAVEDVTALTQPPGAIRLRGQFLTGSEQAYETLAPRIRQRGYTLLFRREEGRPVLILAPGVASPGAGRPWLNLVLLGATVLSMLWVGATMEASSLQEITHSDF